MRTLKMLLVVMSLFCLRVEAGFKNYVELTTQSEYVDLKGSYLDPYRGTPSFRERMSFRRTSSLGEYTYFTQDKNITNINTQFPAKRGLLKEREFGVVATGTYLNVTKAPKRSFSINVAIREYGRTSALNPRAAKISPVPNPESARIVFEYGSFIDYWIYSRVPLSQQVLAEDFVNTHVYFIFPKGMTFIAEYQSIAVIKSGAKISGGKISANDSVKWMRACSPEDTKLYKILRKYNAVIEGKGKFTESDKSEMERAFDNTVEKIGGKVGFGIMVVKGVIKYGLEKAEEKRIEGLREKYGKDCQIYKMPFYSFEGASLKYINIGRRSVVYFDDSKLNWPAKIFIEIPQMTFEMMVSGVVRKARLDGLVYEVGIVSEEYREQVRLLNKALIKAIKNGNLEEVEQLIEKGADVNANNGMGRTVLTEVSCKGHLDIVKYLVENGADDKVMAMTMAVRYEKLDIVKYLLEKGVDVNAVNKNGVTALMEASGGHLNVVKYLLDKGAGVNISNKYGNMALLNAARGGHLDVVKYLLDKGADNKVMALRSAARHGSLDVVKYLLEKGTNINAVSEKGWTALMEASWLGHLDIVKYLLEKGANVSIRCKDSKGIKGKTALGWAIRNRHTAVKTLLEKAGQKSN